MKAQKNSIRLKRLIMMIIRVEHISLFYFEPYDKLTLTSLYIACISYYLEVKDL